MAQGTALKKINARVKYLQTRHPGKKRVTLQKQAGKEYKAGKLGGVKKNPSTRKKLSTGKKNQWVRPGVALPTWAQTGWTGNG